MALLPSSYFVGAIIFGLFIVAGVALISGYQAEDSTLVGGEDLSKFNSTFNSYQKILDESDTYQSKISNGSIDPASSGGFLGGLLANSWSTLSNVNNLLDLMKNAFYGMSSFFNIPMWAVLGILAVISISFVFAVLAAVFQREI